MVKPALLVLTLALLLGGCEDERVCSLDQSSMFLIKCWGTCPSGSCLLKWRAKGSSDPWTLSAVNFRNRDEARDAELEYACYC